MGSCCPTVKSPGRPLLFAPDQSTGIPPSQPNGNFFWNRLLWRCVYSLSLVINATKKAKIARLHVV